MTTIDCESPQIVNAPRYGQKEGQAFFADFVKENQLRWLPGWLPGARSQCGKIILKKLGTAFFIWIPCLHHVLEKADGLWSPHFRPPQFAPRWHAPDPKDSSPPKNRYLSGTSFYVNFLLSEEPPVNANFLSGWCFICFNQLLSVSNLRTTPLEATLV